MVEEHPCLHCDGGSEECIKQPCVEWEEWAIQKEREIENDNSRQR